MNNLSPEVKLNYQALIQDTSFRYDYFEKFVSDVDEIVAGTAASPSQDPEARIAEELGLYNSDKIPWYLHQPVVKILTELIPAYEARFDRMKLCMHDYSWLNVLPDERTLRFQTNNEHDSFRRMPHRIGSKPTPSTRRCVRCCELSGHHRSKVVQRLSARCACNSYLALST